MLERLKKIDTLQKEIDKLRPLDIHALKQLRGYFKVGLTYSSNALEGNSLTESETKVVLEDGITIGGKPLKDHYEAIGHGEAYDLLYQFVKKSKITEDMIKKFHHLFYKRIDEGNAGQYRKVQVFVSGSRYSFPLPAKVSGLMAKFIRQMTQEKKKKHPVEFSAWAHKEFIFIHPFIDGNGRLARLLMNLILLQSGYVVTLIPPILRSEYIQSLEKAHQDEKPFFDFIARMVEQTQEDYLRLLRG